MVFERIRSLRLDGPEGYAGQGVLGRAALREAGKDGPGAADSLNTHLPRVPERERQYYAAKTEVFRKQARRAQDALAKQRDDLERRGVAATSREGKSALEKTKTKYKAPFEMCRFEPRVKFLLEDVCHDRLDPREFPFLPSSHKTLNPPNPLSIFAKPLTGGP
jgi:hypothetical protein